MARPRTTDIGGSVLGAVLGAAMGGPPGAALGGLLGTVANTSRPVALDVALRQALLARGLTFSHLGRETKDRIVVVFSDQPGAFWTVRVDVPAEPTWTADQLDDALYDSTVARIDAWRRPGG